MKSLKAMPAFTRATWSGAGQGHKYEPIPTSTFPREFLPTADANGKSRPSRSFQNRKGSHLAIMSMGLISLLLIWYWLMSPNGSSPPQGCDSFGLGFQCQPEISQFWGQYSPFFAVPSLPQTASDVPDQCQITFAQILSRHGARYPTSAKTLKYSQVVQRIHANAKSYSKQYRFIKDYKYTLGANELTLFGQRQMVNSGIKFYKRYQSLALHTLPFIRASGQSRVIESAQNWTQGFHDSRTQNDPSKSDEYPYAILAIPETIGSNNSLNHGLCSAFETGAHSISDDAQKIWRDIFAPPISARLDENIPGVNFTNEETMFVMDLCPFNTVASDSGEVSPFCALFTESEWHAYDYYLSLGKYYSYSWGNPLGPTQGVGFTNELVARLTHKPVHDHTSTNSTLDSSRKTFPLGRNTSLYADFSHDNDLVAIFSALGLYNSTRPLSNTTIEGVNETNGYSASWTAPFAGRAYFEKMSCANADEEFVRVIVNDRILPLEMCGADKLGRCTLSAFVDSLSFARHGGDWDKCFI